LEHGEQFGALSVSLLAIRKKEKNKKNSRGKTVLTVLKRFQVVLSHSAMRNLAILSCVLGAARHTSAWISTSQARYGAQLDDIIATSYSTSTVNADRSLGFLWSLPASSMDERGLGQSITWAWDPALCDALVPTLRDEALSIRMVGCASLKSAMQRAFDTWSQNHPAISFIEVTDLCEATFQLREGCDHAEVWVTMRNESESHLYTMQPAVAVPKFRVMTDFRHTNGQTPKVDLGNGVLVPRQVIEIQGGRIEFTTSGICWYLDSGACSGLHEMKRFTDPAAVQATGAILIFVFWGLAVAAVIVEFSTSIRKQLKHRAKGTLSA
jgi:hypothetical protein